ncbi:hypothetical protein H634G_10526 [Metarhizium anisopliae BRIP 53293]|uniref:Peptidase S8/S53 domain-containing protein n=1 Tax=Metarhizium anisopliae BRIP 53293 TaxID=1291518 RepID=A0A0D9NNH4_METAN|nr:hypothetical protein H634G_10526 [Metarhizium anisopliae BRIP 53293]KJK88524.1 hypothetical protein H633G_07625 [Metarhizium anisopliae BRIP 53284]
MAVYKHLIALLALFSMITTALAANNDIPTDLENQYSVFLKDGITSSEIDTHLAWVEDLHKNSPGFKQGLTGVTGRFEIGDTHGYDGEFDESTAKQINDRPEVSYVLQDTPAEPLAIIEQKSADWGLAALSSREPGASSYFYDDKAGEGFFAYVVDVGFEPDHEEFGGRLSLGIDFNPDPTDKDGRGHGTAVAGLIGSTTYGAAKKAQMIGVRVPPRSGVAIFKGVLWSVNDIVSKKRAGRAVINLSMGFWDRTQRDPQDGLRVSERLKLLMDNAWSRGILIFNAAGNDEMEVSKSDHPHPSLYAGPHITVGALSPDWNKASFSNYGPLVDIYAPGEKITTLDGNSKSGVLVSDGTSLATPLVAGMALTMLSNMNPLPKPEDTAEILAKEILDTATRYKVGGIPDAGPDELQLVAFNDGRGDPR